MTIDPLRLEVGSPLQLQDITAEQEHRYQVKLIGYLPGGSLLVTTPVVNGKIILVREGQRFAVRLLRGNAVQGFVAAVLQSYVKPYPHLHLAFPKEVESTVVRNARRAATDIAASLRNTRDPDETASYRRVWLIDLSSSGAKIAAAEPLGQIGDLLHLRFRLDVGGVEELLSLLAEIRNRHDYADADNQQQVHIGVQFQSVNRFQQVLLHGHVMERLAQRGAPPDSE